MAAFTLRITKEMGFRKFTSKVSMVDGCYNEGICGYTGNSNDTIKRANFSRNETSVLF